MLSWNLPFPDGSVIYKLIPNHKISGLTRAGVDESRRKISVSKRDDQFPTCGDSCKSQHCSLLLAELHTTDGDCAVVLDKQKCLTIGAPQEKQELFLGVVNLT
jgi:hypothetical protein